MSNTAVTADRLRKVAILVASLEGALAAKLLAELPPDDVRRVKQQLGRLDEVDPVERATVLAEFRGAVDQIGAVSPAATTDHGAAANEGASRPVNSGVEAAFSAESEAAADRPTPPAAPPAKPASPLDEAAPATIAHLLARELPQTVAIMLSRLNEERAGDVFALLPPELQTEALDRLAVLDEADADALDDVQQHFIARLTAHQCEQDRMAAGATLAMKMLSKTDPARRAALLTRLSLPGDDAVEFTATTATEPPSDEPSPVAASAAPRKPRGLRERLRGALSRKDPAPEPAPATDGPALSPLPGDLPGAAEMTSRLATLDPIDLAAALAAAGQRTAQLALAASGREVVQRLSARLPRRQAAALARQLATVGPATLAELCAAQARVLGIAEQLHAAPTSAQAA